ncbi:MAG: lectin, partial [Flavobacteriaceae bacterium]|nr:lectin [Flavobacteriaceae bacterium]
MRFNYILSIFLLVSLSSNISWSQNKPPVITATGNQAFCPLSKIKVVTQFDINNPDDVDVTALYIQISEGYILGEDLLSLGNAALHPNILTKWTPSEGKLSLKSSNSGNVSYSDIIKAVKDVVFESTSDLVSGERYFSFTLGDANYLPSTGHYYEYISAIGITWTNAKDAAETKTYFGLQGYLATISSQEEAKLAGEQAAGAGWIGGSDAQKEGEWKWMTGPENGTIFWNGLSNGSTPNFAFWNTGEPNQAGDEDYAHITAPNVGILGSWNDLSNTGSNSGDFQPKGYIVEYGGTPGDPPLDISASTRIYVPAIESVTSGSNCGPGKVELNALATEFENTPKPNILWFESESDKTPIYYGDQFTTPDLIATKTYYVLASENNCSLGIRTPVIATILDLPVIEPFVDLKNCDEDGIPDGFTDFNLEGATDFITLGNVDLIVTYYLSISDADTALNPIIPTSPFNNSISSIVYGRVENTNGCYDIATVSLYVSTTSFPDNFVYELASCDNDNENDGLFTFDLTEASNEFIDQFPTGQNLRVQYYRNMSDAQLEENEILPQNNYRNEEPYSQILFVRVESNDNGDCFGIGPHLVLTVNPLPEFDVTPTAIVCLNLSPITLEISNPLDNYSYAWKDENDNIISTSKDVTISSGGIYSVIATSSLNCSSFPKIVTVTESIIADVDINDITIIDDSENNTIIIDNQNNNLGIGNYEYALDEISG